MFGPVFLVVANYSARVRFCLRSSRANSRQFEEKTKIIDLAPQIMADLDRHQRSQNLDALAGEPVAGSGFS
jgi:hypothetical protein